ncbi:MAG TPA: efflux RND transporter periplasmic adaptor subunit [Polyangia bacterium]|jgi:membrane fusion protein (multidrug efflux system)
MRYLVAIGTVLVVMGGLAGVKFKQVSSLIQVGRAMAKAGPPPEAVATAQAHEQSWQGTVAAVGSVSPANGVTVANEVAGLVTAIRFQSGALVKRGQPLVMLDTSVEQAQLAAARARKELAATTAGRSRALKQEGAIPGAQLDTDESALRTSSAEAAALRAQIERKTVRASFSGRVGIRLVNVGQYLNPGTPIAVLQAVDALYVDFTLPQQHLQDVTVGMPVRATFEGAAGPVAGTIAAIDPALDSATRTIKLRAAVGTAADGLRPGMFVNVAVVLRAAEPRVVIPATAVVHAAYGDSVFVVENARDERGTLVPGPGGQPAKVARQQFVRLGESRGDFVAVDQGVTAGQEVVIAGAFKLHNRAPVVVNNDVKPNPQLAPHPINR